MCRYVDVLVQVVVIQDLCEVVIHLAQYISPVFEVSANIAASRHGYDLVVKTSELVEESGCPRWPIDSEYVMAACSSGCLDRQLKVNFSKSPIGSARNDFLEINAIPSPFVFASRTRQVWRTVYPSEAESLRMAAGWSDFTYVSVTASTSRFCSSIVLCINAVSLTADQALMQSKRNS